LDQHGGRRPDQARRVVDGQAEQAGIVAPAVNEPIADDLGDA